MQPGADRILARLDALAACSDDADGITRLFLTPAHTRAIALVEGWMQEAGLATRLDASATLVGARAGADAGLLVLGSHIDTVRNAGRYDGCLGVVLAIEAVAALPPDLPGCSIELRAFGDEEGVRFPMTLTGAHAAAGRFDPAWLACADADGVTLRAALAAFGLDTDGLGACAAHGASAYLEVHIEQGPVLEAARAPLGVVTSISGATRATVTVRGRAGHAGTVPMDGRQDALAAACAMVLAVRKAALTRPGTVATVGTLAVTGAAPNVIASCCSFSIDVRSTDDALRHDAMRAVGDALSRIAVEESVRVAIAVTHDAPATPCDTRLQAHLARALDDAGLPVLHLPSGAGHDAMAMAALCPAAMLFVRCAGGISHHPAEAVARGDVADALAVTTHALRHFNPSLLDAPA